jgi:hypothetical protein
MGCEGCSLRVPDLRRASSAQGYRNEILAPRATQRLRLGNKMLAYLATATKEQASRLSRELGGTLPAVNTSARDAAEFGKKQRKKLLPAE